MLKRRGDKLTGNIEITGLDNFETKEYPIEIDLKLLEEPSLDKTIESIALERKKVSIVVQGVVEEGNTKEKVQDTNIEVEITCEDCKDK